jgi:hypothetical protein
MMACALPVLLLPLFTQLAAVPQPQSAPTAATVHTTWFPQVAGWKLTAPPVQYTPDNLFEYIDGGADAFLQFDFDELLTASYVNAQKVEVTVAIYRHRSAARAFGIYTQERPPGSVALPIGTEGNAGPDHLEFVAGPAYVKLAQAGGKEMSFLRVFADKIAAGLPGTREPPPVLKCFPQKGKRPRAEKLAAHNFLGHAFLHDAVAAPYQIEGTPFRLFVIEGKDEGDARAMVQRYSAAAKATVGQIEKTGTLTLKDPLNGMVILCWDGRWLWGAVDLPSPLGPTLPGLQAQVDELGRNLRSGRP